MQKNMVHSYLFVVLLSQDKLCLRKLLAGMIPFLHLLSSLLTDFSSNVLMNTLVVFSAVGELSKQKCVLSFFFSFSFIFLSFFPFFLSFPLRNAYWITIARKISY